MKKMLSLVLALCMAVVLMPVNAFARSAEMITEIEVNNIFTDLKAGEKVKFTAEVGGEYADALEIYEESWSLDGGYYGYKPVISSLDEDAPLPIKGETYRYSISFRVAEGYSIDMNEEIDLLFNGQYVWGSKGWRTIGDGEEEENVFFVNVYSSMFNSFEVLAVDEYIKNVNVTGAPIPLYEGALPTLKADVNAAIKNKAELSNEGIFFFENNTPWWENDSYFYVSGALDDEYDEPSSSSGYKAYFRYEEEYSGEIEKLTSITAGDKYYYAVEVCIEDIENYNFASDVSVSINGKTYTAADGAFIERESGIVMDFDESLSWDEQARVNLLIAYIPVTAVKKANNKSGWKKEGANWYYYENGTPAKGWKKVDGKWYYLDTSTGAMKQWYQTIGGKKYYFNSKGEMVTGWVKFNATGKWHYFKADGSEATGWFKDGADWYYANAQGEMQNNMWIKSGGKWYYLTNSGKMAVNMSIIYKGKYYKFDKNGVCLNP